MPEGKKNTAPLPAPVRDEDGYSAKTHLHQPVQETATVAATALLADAPEGALPSEVRPEIVTWEKLCEAIQASGKAYNMEMIQKAYELANNAHNGVCRRSGEPYICHPLAVARLVLDLGMDSESIAAALLHDVVEDTPTTLDDLKAAFGEEVALLVDGVTKLTKIQFSNIEELQAENLRKMLLAMSRDVRVMIIKLCDRLHNMRTGDGWPEQKRRDKALETMEVYAPIAHRLGMSNVKEELEDRSLQYLDPVGYEEITSFLAQNGGADSFISGIADRIKERLAENGMDKCTIKKRIKSVYGIYRKMYIQGKNFDEIYDIYAVRVIVHTVTDCYNVLGIVSSVLGLATAGFGWMTACGAARMKAGRQMGQFADYADSVDYHKGLPVSMLADLTHQTKKKALKKLRSYIHKGWLNAWLDDETETLYLTAEDYRAAKEKATAAAAQPQPEKEETGDALLNLDTARRFAAVLEKEQQLMQDAQAREELAAMHKTTTAICDWLEAHPESQPKTRRFAEYYIPTTLKLLHTYNDVQGQQGENAETIRRDIAGILHTLNQAYENLYNNLLSDVAMDISSEIAALQGMLANDGLTGREFE